MPVKSSLTNDADKDLAYQLYATMTLAAACDERLRRGAARGEFGVSL
jgi:hypothetical protein